eukprot:8109383-Prorocentrum_lima.AAC.1
MTSSLVGSEMCIRDRCKAADVYALMPGHDMQQADTTQAYTQSKLGGIPVSYTHLTLPTICSV